MYTVLRGVIMYVEKKKGVQVIDIFYASHYLKENDFLHYLQWEP